MSHANLKVLASVPNSGRLSEKLLTVDNTSGQFTFGIAIREKARCITSKHHQNIIRASEDIYLRAPGVTYGIWVESQRKWSVQFDSKLTGHIRLDAGTNAFGHVGMSAGA
jgi:hypothetical protein